VSDPVTRTDPLTSAPSGTRSQARVIAGPAVHSAVLASDDHVMAWWEELAAGTQTPVANKRKASRKIKADNPAPIGPDRETPASPAGADDEASGGASKPSKGGRLSSGRPKPRKSIVTLLETLTIGLALIGLLVGYLAWRLSIGTISIAALVPTVEDALDRVIGGHTEVGALRLGFDQDRGEFLVYASQIKASRTEGGAPLQLGSVDLTLDPVALFGGQARVTQAQFSGVQAILVFDQSGATSIGFGTVEEALAQPRRRGDGKALRQIIDLVRKNLDAGGRGGALESMSLADAGLTVVRAESRQSVRFQGVSARISRDLTNIVTLELDGNTPELGGTLDLTIVADLKGTRPITAKLDVANLNPAKLPEQFLIGRLDQLRRINSAMTSRGTAVLDEDGTILSLSSDMLLGAGSVAGQSLTQAKANLVWEGGDKPYIINNVSAVSKTATLVGGRVEVGALRAGSRNVTAQGDVLEFSGAQGTRLTARKLAGTASVLQDHTLQGADIRFQELGLKQSAASSWNSQAGQLKLVRAAGEQKYDVALSSARMAVQHAGVSVDLADSKSTLSNVSIAKVGPQFIQNISQLGPDINLVSQARAASIDRGGSGLRASGVVISAQDLQLGAMPNTLSVAIDSVVTVGQARGQGKAITLALQKAPGGGYRATGSVGALNLTGLAPLNLNPAARVVRGIGSTEVEAVVADNLVFDVGYDGASSAGQKSQLQARRLGVGLLNSGFEAENLVFDGRLGRAEGAQGLLQASRATIVQDQQLERPFSVNDLSYRGGVTRQGASILSASFEHRGVRIAGGGNIVFSRRGSGQVDIDADVSGDLSVETLFSAWPRGFLAETRGDLTRIIQSGTARTRAVKLRIPQGILKGQAAPDSAILIDFEVENATARYLDGMTSLTGIYGKGRLEGNNLLLEADRAQIGDISVSEAVLDLSRFQPRGGTARLTARAQGDATSMLEEINRPPLRLLANGNFDPRRVAGQGWVQLDLQWPLLKRPPSDSFEVTAVGAFSNASMTKVLGELDAVNGDVTLSVEDRMVRVSGKAQVARSDVDFAWTLNANDLQTQREAHDIAPGTMLLLTDAKIRAEDIAALGLDVGAHLSGTVATSVRAASDRARFTGGVISLDLAQAGITIPGRAWSKPEGVAATGSAQIVLGETNRTTLQNIVFDTQGAFARGTIDLDPELNISAARFSRLFIEGMADVSVDYVDKPDAVNVLIRGPFLNLAPFLAKRDVTEQAVDLFDRPLGLEAQIDRVQTDASSNLTQVQASIVRDAYGWRSLRSVATDNVGVSQVRLDQLDDGRRTISGTLNDAGLYARLLYAGAPIFGGAATIEGELPVVGATSSGTLLFQATDVTYGEPSKVQYKFDTISLPMKVQGGVISFQDGKAMGAAMTVKGAGYIDVEDGTVDVRGLATPGGLNRLFGELPVLGGLLGSRQDEGLVGMTLAVKGSLEKPVLQVNPISALAPGFLRRIFEAATPLPPTPKFDPARFTSTRSVEQVYGPTED
jgi:Protein of unknown function